MASLKRGDTNDLAVYFSLPAALSGAAKQSSAQLRSHTISKIEYKTADAQSLCATAAVVLLRSQDQTFGSWSLPLADPRILKHSHASINNRQKHMLQSIEQMAHSLELISVRTSKLKACVTVSLITWKTTSASGQPCCMVGVMTAHNASRLPRQQVWRARCARFSRCAQAVHDEQAAVPCGRAAPPQSVAAPQHTG